MFKWFLNYILVACPCFQSKENECARCASVREAVRYKKKNKNMIDSSFDVAECIRINIARFDSTSLAMMCATDQIFAALVCTQCY